MRRLSLTKLKPVTAQKKDRLTPSIEVHDRQQFEIRFTYTLSNENLPEKYAVDTYFFVPRNVGVNRNNYSKEQFYSNVTPLVRLDAARLSLQELADPECSASPLRQLQKTLHYFQTSSRPPASRTVGIHVKLYAHLYVSAVKRELQRLGRNFRSLDLHDESACQQYEKKFVSVLGKAKKRWTFTDKCALRSGHSSTPPMIHSLMHCVLVMNI